MRPSPYKKSPAASIQESASEDTIKGSESMHSFLDMDFFEDDFETPNPAYIVALDLSKYAAYYLYTHEAIFSPQYAPLVTALASSASLTLLPNAHSSTESLPSAAARVLHGHRDDAEDTPKLPSSVRIPSWIRQIDEALDSPETVMSEGFPRLSFAHTETEDDVSVRKARRASSVEYSYATQTAQIGPRMRKDSLPRKLASKLGKGLKELFNASQQPPIPPVPQYLAPPPMRRAISSQP
ncbi:hypothetical protein AURDEDRAFT_171442 [Auricularia subglabra TFB-10046 SS5]|nr:hypothetical protein AURDEDRAFT_171442 [Auricularia subglabra TFB-10046 SS5]